MPARRSSSTRSSDNSCSRTATLVESLCISFVCFRPPASGQYTGETPASTLHPCVYKPTLATLDFVLFSFSACRSTKLSSFSREEKRCRISCIRRAILRMVSTCERALGERLPVSISNNSELRRTDVHVLLRLWQIQRI